MSHRYYTPDGTCLAGLREARLHGAVPSVTTVTKLIVSFALQRYFQDQIIEACRQTPCPPDKPYNEWKADVIIASEAHSTAARDHGTRFHEWMTLFYLTFPKDPGLYVEGYEEHCRLVMTWFHENVAEIITQEQVVFGDRYAGRMDCLALTKSGQIILPDIKTQGIKPTARVFNKYPDWSLQLGAYAGSNTLKKLGTVPTVLMSLVISSNPDNAIFEPYVWPEPPLFYHGLFEKLLDVWCLYNNYWPDIDKAKDPNEVSQPKQKQPTEYDNI